MSFRAERRHRRCSPRHEESLRRIPADAGTGIRKPRQMSTSRGCLFAEGFHDFSGAVPALLQTDFAEKD